MIYVLSVIVFMLLAWVVDVLYFSSDEFKKAH
ncbi:hypothetical protein LMG8286_00496 [Campylobacter suis]|uniref:Uncharacterized protein n=1 Tax=Campylobacter suis TaxID=2790657 RepID=A0ABM8Q1P9_9BACT|nr:hypothetical protein LMG8286_00496 [Campylobacter suis]